MIIGKKTSIENNKDNVVQNREMKKGVTMILSNDKLRYEDEVDNEKGEIREQSGYKGNHKGSVLVGANVKSKYRAKNNAIV